ncbi:DUF3099 domain-containing protein [Microbacterium sp. NPDC055357]
MRNSSARQSATSLPASPHDDTSDRAKHYLITMGVRVACFVLMVAITPYGWYTWVLGAAAVFLPYFAVVTANVSKSTNRTTSESPELALPSQASPTAADGPTVIRLNEARAVDEGPHDATGPAEKDPA